jgi:hypothetical protein
MLRGMARLRCREGGPSQMPLESRRQMRLAECSVIGNERIPQSKGHSQERRARDPSARVVSSFVRQSCGRDHMVA